MNLVEVPMHSKIRSNMLSQLNLTMIKGDDKLYMRGQAEDKFQTLAIGVFCDMDENLVDENGEVNQSAYYVCFLNQDDEIIVSFPCNYVLHMYIGLASGGAMFPQMVEDIIEGHEE